MGAPKRGERRRAASKEAVEERRASRRVPGYCPTTSRRAAAGLNRAANNGWAAWKRAAAGAFWALAQQKAKNPNSSRGSR